MKKINKSILAAVLACALCACGGGSTNPYVEKVMQIETENKDTILYCNEGYISKDKNVSYIELIEEYLVSKGEKTVNNASYDFWANCGKSFFIYNYSNASALIGYVDTKDFSVAAKQVEVPSKVARSYIYGISAQYCTYVAETSFGGGAQYYVLDYKSDSIVYNKFFEEEPSEIGKYNTKTPKEKQSTFKNDLGEYVVSYKGSDAYRVTLNEEEIYMINDEFLSLKNEKYTQIKEILGDEVKNYVYEAYFYDGCLIVNLNPSKKSEAVPIAFVINSIGNVYYLGASNYGNIDVALCE